MTWNYLILTTILFIAGWLSGVLLLALKKESGKSGWIVKTGPFFSTLVLAVFIVILWGELERPPLRTMAETRLWYALFVSGIIGLIYIKTRDKTLYFLGAVMASVFLVVDVIHPEYRSKTLMPALQSPWFIPHVIIYMISYAVLAAACLSALQGLFHRSRSNSDLQDHYLGLSMQLVYPGFALLTVGMIMGAFWAKIAWGNYWTWDPKETWALLTWLFYLITIHLHYSFPKKRTLLLWMLGLSFIILIMTWLGIRFLPGMQSVHVYG